MSSKSWVLTKSSTFAPNGALRLGQLLTKPYDPTSTLISRNLPVIPDDMLTDNLEHHDIDLSTETHEHAALRIWLRTVSNLIPAKIDGGAERGMEVWAGYRGKTVKVSAFAPDDAYAEQAVRAGASEKRGEVPWWSTTKSLWLVTGLRIFADGASAHLGSSRFAGHHMSAAADATDAGVPAEGGVQTQSHYATQGNQRIGNASSFVYAYRLHKVIRRREPKTASVHPWGDGDLFSVGETNEEKYLPRGDRTQEEDRVIVILDGQPFRGDGSENDDTFLVE